MSYIVTGGCGFIGSNFVNYICETTDKNVIVIDKMTYAASKDYINKSFIDEDRVRFLQWDIAENSTLIGNVFTYNEIEGIFHFAAESHVDNSIAGPGVFIKSNVRGTFNLLECCREYDVPRFLQVSTDEVYGDLTEESPSFTENKCLNPSNVYSATKAGADMLVNAYHRTYDINTIVTRCCNNYGPRQHREKLIPTVISNALNDVPIPVYGKGTNIREWINVYDHCTAIKTVFDCGESGEVYNLGSGVEITNIDLVKRILKIMNKPASLIKFVNDRPGHDFRYAIDNSKFRSLPDNNWQLKYSADKFNEGLEETVSWYKDVS